MSDKTPEVSVVISHYNAQKQLIACLTSLYKQTKRVRFEVIVNENDLRHPVGKELQKAFPDVTYVKAPRDLGFGGGHNHAESYATGEYIFLLNADTLLYNNVIQELLKFAKTHKKAGIVSPLLYQDQEKPYPLQGSAVLTPLRGIFILTVFNRIFFWLPIVKHYWQADWVTSQIRKIAVVPGTAMFMKRSLFEKVGRFDERMFIYFEDHDISKRVVDSGYTNYIIPQAKLYHEWGASTTNKQIFNQHFSESRFYYFTKHYGKLSAYVISWVAGLSAFHLLLLGILLITIAAVYLLR